VIKIFPKNPISKFGTKNWLEIGKEFGFDFIVVPSIEKAYEYLKVNHENS
jgi:hypothetical protein